MKNILITGAASGLGKEIAKLLSTEKLILVDKDEKKLKKIATNLNCDYNVCDLTKIDEVKALKEKLYNSKIDVLVNCAGVWSKGELSQLESEHFAKMNTLERIKYVLDTNTFGTIAMITEFAPFMMKNNKGQIININSQSGVEREEFCPIYNTSKHASYAYRLSIQRDLAKHNIKITDVCPGLMQTDLFSNADDALPAEVMATQGLKPQAVAKVVKYLIDLPSEITIPSIEVRHIKNY